MTKQGGLFISKGKDADTPSLENGKGRQKVARLM